MPSRRRPISSAHSGVVLLIPAPRPSSAPSHRTARLAGPSTFYAPFLGFHTRFRNSPAADAGGRGCRRGRSDPFPKGGGGRSASGWSPDEWASARVPRGRLDPCDTPGRPRRSAKEVAQGRDDQVRGDLRDTRVVSLGDTGE